MSAQEIVALREMVASLESQLIALYQAQNGKSIDELQATIASLEEQVCSFYADCSFNAGGESFSMVDNLEKQIISLIEEKADLEKEIGDFNRDLMRVKTKAREMGAALFEAALFNSMPKAA